ncbi:hypothetical protein ACHAPU_005214 [Fusarium lateritium]
MSHKTPFTVTYKKDGTSAPVFIAGSFSDPPWQLQEMICATGQDGEHIFQSKVMLEPEQDYQFKLRLGHDNWWVLAEDYPTATDDSGNENNVLRAPHKPTEEQAAPAGIDAPAINAAQSASAPTEMNNADESVANSTVPMLAHESFGDDTKEDTKEDTEENNAPLLAHESFGNDPQEEDAEGSSAPLFAHESLGNDTKEEDTDDFKAPLLAHESLGDDTREDAEDMKMPLFAHECLGAYDFEEQAEHDLAPIAGGSPRQNGNAKSQHDKVANIDVNDPTLENFPSERGSILDAIRTIQTHLGEDQTHLDDIPSSPRVISSRRTSLDSNDDLCLSPVTLNPTVTRRRDSRPSHSFGRTRSAVSLGSIEEEPKPSNKRSQGPPIVSLPNPNSRDKIVGQKSPPSEEDEAVVMKTSEVKPSTKIDNESSSQVESYEDQTSHQAKASSAATTEDPSGATKSQMTDDRAIDALSLDKPTEDETPVITDLNPVSPPKELPSVPESNSERKAKKPTPVGGSSRSPPGGSLVPM